ncbi:hypothetical protein EV356DRAFT_523854 [Viridothelium virens]|uniref:Uncharacterized protein n=1 Tax=Viridothelium virens TaxID=1048519 RepID=A0A6A6HNP8_VIRVR|nr:hypothetical protein EV356DRAFT_523854 [Viridothelium virens]
MSLFFRLLLLTGLVSAQNYVGTQINNSLPFVPGSEITYFNVISSSGLNLTLTNYMSLNSSGKRFDPTKIQRAVIIIHGLQRDPGTYMANILSALSQVPNRPDVSVDSVAIMAPYFPNGDDKNYGYPWTDGLAPGKGSTTNALVWQGSQWAGGANNQYPSYSVHTSSYDALDQAVKWFDNTAVFPNMHQIVIAGHSLGAQTTNRYAAIGSVLNTKSPVNYWIANPNSWLWFNSSRPLDTSSCPTYDDYREGLSNFTNTYGATLLKGGGSAVLARWNSRNINFARGTQDTGDDSTTCAPETTGSNRNERFFNFIRWFPPSCPNPTSGPCDTVDYVNVGHDAGAMMASPAGQARLFLDNFSGDKSKATDFGCPRLQTGDDPYPNSTCTQPVAHPDQGTYSGLTYQGCYSNSAATLDLCASSCVKAGYSIAGAEYGNE